MPRPDPTHVLHPPQPVPTFTLRQSRRPGDVLVLTLTGESTRGAPEHGRLLFALLRRRFMPGAHHAFGYSGGDDRWELSYLAKRAFTDEDLADAQTCLATWAAHPVVDLLVARGRAIGERPFSHFTPETTGDELALWTRSHYAAAGIDDPESLEEIAGATTWTYDRTAPDAIRVADRSFLMEDRVIAYAELLRRGIALPPAVQRRHGQLREGYHRRAAHLRAGLTEMPRILFG